MTTPGISPLSRCPDHQKNVPQYFYDETLEGDDADIPGTSFSHSEPPVPARSALPSWVPRSIEIDFNPWENNDGLKQEVIRQAQQVLQSALMNATQTVPTSKTGLALNNERFEPSEPVSPEFLTWMLQGMNLVVLHQKSESRKLTRSM